MVRWWEYIKMNLRERYLKMCMPGRCHRGKYHKVISLSNANIAGDLKQIIGGGRVGNTKCIPEFMVSYACWTTCYRVQCTVYLE
jgi:hypothetical protein